MSSRDIIDFNQVSVKFVDDEEATKLLSNPIYRPILLILREGIKTAEEIAEEFKAKDEYEAKDIKTIYRHLKALSDVDIVIQAGVRILDRTEEDKPPVTQKLFARTAKFFYLTNKTEKVMEPKKLQKRVEILTKLFALTHKVDKSTIDNLKKIIEKLRSFELEESEILFKQFPDELAEIVGNLPLEELQHTLEDYLILKILLQKSNYEKDLKEILKD
ncbi:MAG: helix-turn-helix domain-containing protein [Asgard group archaeon]|nr:helix-turn-helix domain-containing protein [Asgard group archaeon]